MATKLASKMEAQEKYQKIIAKKPLLLVKASKQQKYK